MPKILILITAAVIWAYSGVVMVPPAAHALATMETWQKHLEAQEKAKNKKQKTAPKVQKQPKVEIQTHDTSKKLPKAPKATKK